MRDTDWRPSPCPECGRLRNAAKYPVCENIECREYGRGGPDKVERTMKTVKLYLWVKKGNNPKIIEDVLSLYKNPDFDAEHDQIFEIGPEVKLELSVKVAPTTRNSSGGYITTFEPKLR